MDWLQAEEEIGSTKAQMNYNMGDSRLFVASLLAVTPVLHSPKLCHGVPHD
jgi:hypothetical protein